MPIEFSVDKNSNIIHTTMIGSVGLADIMDYLSKRFESAEAQSGMDSLIDLRNMEPFKSSESISEIARFAADNSIELGTGRTAIVSPSDVNRGFANMYIAMARGVARETSSFRDYDEALEWLARNDNRMPELP